MLLVAALGLRGVGSQVVMVIHGSMVPVLSHACSHRHLGLGYSPPVAVVRCKPFAHMPCSSILQQGHARYSGRALIECWLSAPVQASPQAAQYM